MESDNHKTADSNRLFPVFLKLEALKVLLVGGGKVGGEKLTALLQNEPDARVLLVATVISSEVRALAEGKPNIELAERPFRHEDVQGADIVIAAVNDPVTSRGIRQAARLAGKLVNVADAPALCDFYLGSIVQKGHLKIGISTNGKSPTIAKRLKENLQELLPEELDELLEHMHAIREQLRGDFTEKVNRLNELTRELAVKP